MKGEWCFFNSYFSPQSCNEILEEGMKIPGGQATLSLDGNVTDDNFRRSEVRFIPNTNQKLGWLFDNLWKMAIIANNDWFNFHITRITFIQLAEYNSSYQGEYKKHHDVFWINNDPIYHRKLTAVVQLTDPNTYEGGDFQLYDVNQYPDPKIIREQGTVIFLPSFVNHAALPVTKGVRHSLACWFEGPKWR